MNNQIVWRETKKTKEIVDLLNGDLLDDWVYVNIPSTKYPAISKIEVYDNEHYFLGYL